MKYVISDLHGEYDDFLKMIKLIDLKSTDTLFVLGDVFDRGRYPISILKLIMTSKNIEFVLGNHEEMALQYFKTKDYLDKRCWELYGGHTTLAEFDKLTSQERSDIINFLETAPLYKVIDKFVLSHSGLVVPACGDRMTIEEILSMQSREDFLWSREEFFNYPGIKEYTIIFGHTVTKDLYSMWSGEVPNPFSIWHDNLYGGDKIGIDCGARLKNNGGRLGCLRLDDMKEFYV